MEIVLSDRSNELAVSPAQGKDLIAIPVAGGSSGEGLPYAPEDWPNPGDKWRWKVGNRKCAKGHWIDRTLFAPKSCPKFVSTRPGFQSKVSLQQYLRKEFPNADINAFFSSFIWKVRCADTNSLKGNDSSLSISAPSINLASIDPIIAEPAVAPGGCRAGNVSCSSLTRSNDECLTLEDCSICCSESGFCRDCCCILCGRIIEIALGGYSFIRCEAAVNESFICGHRAHLECALRCFMAGTVGGSIGLDVQYYCRRCDSKTDLMPHVTEILKVCESIDSRDDAQKVLELGLCILRCSEQIRAKDLCIRIGLAIAKLKRGVSLGEIWKLEADSAAFKGDMNYNGSEIMRLEDTMTNEIEFDFLDNVEPLQQIEPATGDHCEFNKANNEGLAEQLEDRVDQVLEELKRSQAMEYRNAEEKLHAQKDLLLNLYKELDYEKSKLVSTVAPSGGKNDAPLFRYSKRVEQIKHEEEKLVKMMKVAYGFQRTPRSTLTEYFGLKLVD